VNNWKIEDPAEKRLLELAKEEDGVLWFTPDCRGSTREGRILPLGAYEWTQRQIDQLLDPRDVCCEVDWDFFGAISRGAVVPILEVDGTLRGRGSATWAFGFIYQAIEACRSLQGFDTEIGDAIRYPIPTHLLASATGDEATGPFSRVAWSQAFAPGQIEISSAYPAYEHLLDTVLVSLAACLLDEQALGDALPLGTRLCQELTLFLLVTPFGPMLRWLPESHLTTHIGGLSPEWLRALEQVDEAVRAVTESEGHAFGKTVDNNFRLAMSLGRSFWQTVAEVLFCHLPLVDKVFGAKIAELPVCVQERLRSQLQRLASQRGDFAADAAREWVAGLHPGLDTDHELPELLTEVRQVLSDCAGIGRWHFGQGHYCLKNMLHVDHFVFLNSVGLHHPHRSLVADVEHELAHHRNIPGASYWLDTTDQYDVTAFVTIVGRGLIVVVPKDIAVPQLAEMLPELPAGDYYVPAWEKLRDWLSRKRQDESPSTQVDSSHPEHEPGTEPITQAAGTETDEQLDSGTTEVTVEFLRRNIHNEAGELKEYRRTADKFELEVTKDGTTTNVKVSPKNFLILAAIWAASNGEFGGFAYDAQPQTEHLPFVLEGGKLHHFDGADLFEGPRANLGSAVLRAIKDVLDVDDTHELRQRWYRPIGKAKHPDAKDVDLQLHRLENVVLEIGDLAPDGHHQIPDLTMHHVDDSAAAGVLRFYDAAIGHVDNP
jgi:hypothetical protein